MKKDDCFHLGKITKTQGIKGNVYLFLDTDQPEAYKELESVFVEINNALIPFFIDYFQLTAKQKALVKFENVDSEEEAKDIVNKDLYLPINLLPKLTDKQFYYHEIIGFTLIDEVFGEVGKIEEVVDVPGNSLLQVDHNGTEVLVPLNNSVVKNVDRTNNTILAALPPGLLDIYLGE
jgi:16S rRNA processing protein RimM